tara:strand:- start:53 stop:682 length:630 start_codon:yes stop_codon:yes gene_type:complete
MNGTVVKNQLIFDFASGILGPAKSIFASTYLQLNSSASKIGNTFEGMLGENLMNNVGIVPKSLKYSDCINKDPFSDDHVVKDPITGFFGDLNNLNWKQVYKGFREFTASIEDKDELKLIKMDPGVSVPLHSHGGKEYILVLEGSFRDEYGEYSKGDIQINDQKIKHTPIASNDTGCVCLSITEKDVIFFGKYGSFLNLFTFIKSFFRQK